MNVGSVSIFTNDSELGKAQQLLLEVTRSTSAFEAACARARQELIEAGRTLRRHGDAFDNRASQLQSAGGSHSLTPPIAPAAVETSAFD
jgi:hypothetical protein